MKKSLAMCSVVLWPALAAAQSPVPQPAAQSGLRAPIHSQADDDGVAYGLWAAGADYKVDFSGDMTFVPYLGGDYPHNQPWSWRTASVKIGSTELLDGAAPSRWHDDYRFEYRYGAVSEAYDVRLEGLEQTFVLHRRPVARGDLVVRGTVRTGLRTEPAVARHGELVFHDDAGRAIVAYGAAFVLDAGGRKAPVTTAFAEGGLELTVPGAWLEEAEFPVVVDPLLTRRLIASGNGIYLSSDVCRDDTGNDLMVCYTRLASATDQDALAEITSDSFGVQTLVFSDITASWSTPRIVAACAGSPQKYLVVFERRLGGGAKIRYHLRASGDLGFSVAVTTLSTPVGTHDWFPDVGGQILGGGPFPITGSEYLIAFQRDTNGGLVPTNTSTSAIWGRVVSGAGVAGAAFPISPGATFAPDSERPSVNQQARALGLSTDWVVAYQELPAGRPTWRVYAKKVDDSGVVDSQRWSASDNGNTDHLLAPQIAGHSDRYLVAYTRVVGGGGAAPVRPYGHELRSQRMNWGNGQTPVQFGHRTLYGPFADTRMNLGAVAYDFNTRSHWAIVSSSLRGFGGTGRVIVDRVGYGGLPTEQRSLHNPANGNQNGIPGGICFDDDHDRFPVVWTMNEIGGTDRVLGDHLTYVTPNPPAVSGVSCSSATIGWSGSAQIGSEFSRVTLANAPSGAFAFLLVSFAPRDLNLSSLQLTGCRLLVENSGPNYIGLVTTTASATGSVFQRLALPEFLGPDDIYFQWFHTDIGANPRNIVSTERLKVNIVK